MKPNKKIQDARASKDKVDYKNYTRQWFLVLRRSWILLLDPKNKNSEGLINFFWEKTLTLSTQIGFYLKFVSSRTSILSFDWCFCMKKLNPVDMQML